MAYRKALFGKGDAAEMERLTNAVVEEEQSWKLAQEAILAHQASHVAQDKSGTGEVGTSG